MIRALLSHGLNATNLTRCWVERQVQPLILRTKLMSEYTGSKETMKFSNIVLMPIAVVRAAKRLLGETKGKIGQVVLDPLA